MTVPYFISEDRSDMRGIKRGWYVMEDEGDLSSGPFSSHEECLSRITQPTNGSGCVAFTAKIATEAAEPMNTGLSEAFN